MGSWLKRSLVRSLVYAVALSIAAYALSWGLFITHGELGVSPSIALSVALWTFVIVLLGGVVLFAAKGADARRK
jgi:hypothetical protein